MPKPEVHTTHCCPVHGCKYGDDHCPVKLEMLAPKYPHNNGCEMCHDTETLFVGKCPPTAKTERVPINIDPDVRDSLGRLLYHPAMRGVGYSAFLNQAINLAKRDIARGKTPHDA